MLRSSSGNPFRIKNQGTLLADASDGKSGSNRQTRRAMTKTQITPFTTGHTPAIDSDFVAGKVPRNLPTATLAECLIYDL
jgi:hypothetical protein